MGTAYLTIPNEIDFDLAAMFGMIQSCVSVPGYQKTNGGLKDSLTKKVNNGTKSFNRVWKGLYETGYLKRVRMPKQCKIEIGFAEREIFYDFYQLFSSPVTDVPSVRNMTIAQGTAFLHHFPAHYQGAVENYTGVSRKVLEDSNLKLVDKNLYILIRKLLLLQSRNKNVVLSKEYIRYKSGLHAFKFNHAWKRLREAGYLVLKQSYDHINKHTVFLFSLPMENQIDRQEKEPVLAITKKKKTAYQINREQIRSFLEEKAEGDVLRDWAKNRSDSYYSESDVNKILIQLTDVLCSESKSFRISDTIIPADDVKNTIYEHIEPEILHDVLNRMVERPPKKNAKHYMVALVYTECTTPTK